MKEFVDSCMYTNTGMKTIYCSKAQKRATMAAGVDAGVQLKVKK